MVAEEQQEGEEETKVVLVEKKKIKLTILPLRNGHVTRTWASFYTKVTTVIDWAKSTCMYL